jgi:hypothetical protein
MARIIPFLLDGKTVPESLFKSNKAQYWIWFILITVDVILVGFCSYLLLVDEPNKLEYEYQSFFLLALALLCIIVIFYLGLSIYRIKKLTT